MLGLKLPIIIMETPLFICIHVCVYAHADSLHNLLHMYTCNVYVNCFSQNCLAFLTDLIERIQLFAMNDLIFVPLSSILEAYRSGRGRVTVRGKTDVELLDSKTKRTAIIIKEVMILDSFV